MPPDYNEIRLHYRTGSFILSLHAQVKATQRRITSDEIAEAIETGEVIEDYPEDKYGPSCLILGYTKARRALHVQLCYPPAAKIITTYDPDPDKWEADLKTRKTDG
jgi:hypothetical protein